MLQSLQLPHNMFVGEALSCVEVLGREPYSFRALTGGVVVGFSQRQEWDKLNNSCWLILDIPKDLAEILEGTTNSFC